MKKIIEIFQALCKQQLGRTLAADVGGGSKAQGVVRIFLRASPDIQDFWAGFLAHLRGMRRWGGELAIKNTLLNWGNAQLRLVVFTNVERNWLKAGIKDNENWTSPPQFSIVEGIECIKTRMELKWIEMKYKLFEMCLVNKSVNVCGWLLNRWQNEKPGCIQLWKIPNRFFLPFSLNFFIFRFDENYPGEAHLTWLVSKKISCWGIIWRSFV